MFNVTCFVIISCNVILIFHKWTTFSSVTLHKITSFLWSIQAHMCKNFLSYYCENNLHTIHFVTLSIENSDNSDHTHSESCFCRCCPYHFQLYFHHLLLFNVLFSVPEYQFQWALNLLLADIKLEKNCMSEADILALVFITVIRTGIIYLNFVWMHLLIYIDFDWSYLVYSEANNS